MVVFRELERFARELQDARGYQEISTPILVNKRLWEQSGHWEHYSENMFKVEAEEQIFSLKPMNCPESTFAYRHALRSYRDLPLRFSEMGRLHRNERSGTLTGLFRVRQITMDDAHIYCRPDQLQAEITARARAGAGVLPDLRARAALPARDAAGEVPRRRRSSGTKPSGPSRRRSGPTGCRSTLKPGDGAFYGPKIDIHIEDVLGRDWQMATVQADLTMLPERFQLEFVDSDGRPKRPVAIHRAILGSFERFIGILIEHFAGAFPAWLAPVQARVLPVSAKHAEYAGSVHRRLLDAGRAGGARRSLGEARVQGARGAGPEGAVRAGGG